MPDLSYVLNDVMLSDSVLFISLSSEQILCGRPNNDITFYFSILVFKTFVVHHLNLTARVICFVPKIVHTKPPIVPLPYTTGCTVYAEKL